MRTLKKHCTLDARAAVHGVVPDNTKAQNGHTAKLTSYARQTCERRGEEGVGLRRKSVRTLDTDILHYMMFYFRGVLWIVNTRFGRSTSGWRSAPILGGQTHLRWWGTASSSWGMLPREICYYNTKCQVCTTNSFTLCIVSLQSLFTNTRHLAPKLIYILGI